MRSKGIFNTKMYFDIQGKVGREKENEKIKMVKRSLLANNRL